MVVLHTASSGGFVIRPDGGLAKDRLSHGKARDLMGNETSKAPIRRSVAAPILGSRRSYASLGPDREEAPGHNTRGAMAEEANSILHTAFLNAPVLSLPFALLPTLQERSCPRP